ncbi:MAG: hypothetical protein LUQ38_11025 [Methanotrichaceae archaeon]|nr:hypothetical protein [Methanotrichaceae archaeon]
MLGSPAMLAHPLFFILVLSSIDEQMAPRKRIQGEIGAGVRTKPSLLVNKQFSVCLQKYAHRETKPQEIELELLRASNSPVFKVYLNLLLLFGDGLLLDLFLSFISSGSALQSQS